MSTYHIIEEIFGQKKSSIKMSIHQMMKKIFSNSNDDWIKNLQEWTPGQNFIENQTFDANTEQGHALIGSPHGYGISLLLLQHQEQLGYKTIDKITVFKTRIEVGAKLNILFKLKKPLQCKALEVGNYIKRKTLDFSKEKS